jgi:Fe/S biogenesis protein NfuA
MRMSTQQNGSIIEVDDGAREMLLEVRSREPDAAELGLVLRISGLDGAAFTYEMAFMRTIDAGPTDVVEEHDDLAVIIPKGDADNLRGARLTMSRDLLNPGLAIKNPNGPSPRILGDGDAPELTGSVAEQAVQVMNDVINPAIAAHGGFGEVVAVEEGTAYVRLGGGCVGCGMASVTLSSGIESTLQEMVPEIVKVIDVTDHASGTNPYYEQEKK